VKHPVLPQVQRWDTIERLNKEKDLIGIYLSAHPLDEYEYEVRELCNITTEELTEFDKWRRPDARSEAEYHIRAAMAENPEEKQVLPSDFIAKHKNQACLLGGVITQAEQLRSQKGNPYGRYTIEDYTGSYQVVLFGNAYNQFAHLMLKDLYVMVTGVIQQKGAGMKWFKEGKDEEAEFEFVVQSVDMLSEVQDKRTEGINIRLSLDAVTPENIDEMADIIDENPGNGRLHVSVYNPLNRQSVALTSRNHAIRVTPKLYKWLCNKRAEGILDFKAVAAS
jgi:DNA polymerase-3 subunit alpha